MPPNVLPGPDVRSAMPVRRVLIYRLGSLGDHLVALPSYNVVARAFPAAERRLLTNIPIATKAAAAEAVLQGSGLVHSYMSYAAGERDVRALLRLVWTVRAWRPDVVVYLAGARGLGAARRDRWFFRACGVRRIVGLPDAEALQVNRVAGERNGVSWHEREGERLLRCIAPLGSSQGDVDWRLTLSASERARATELLAPLGPRREYFAVSLGTKSPSNQWGPARWAALLRGLAANHRAAGLAVVGAPDEHAASELLAQSWREVNGETAAVNLCGACSPRESAAVMAGARLFVGHDSGPAHMAAAVGVPVQAVFGSRNPAGVWAPAGAASQLVLHRPPCGGCGLDICAAEGKRCIETIEVDEVLDAALRLLHTGVADDRLRVIA